MRLSFESLRAALADGFVYVRAEPVDMRSLMGNKPTFAWICAILNDDTGT
jgi:hypothetical protein